ncbi:hypothetical protein C2G38_2198594 [Gigaspora rosea]|uniref:HMG box domain-containing protein n=1 Tax=Gigaspora rosea TaxID=44941 RepID=A0A397V1G2_9GLOM|nr:hypothetical protein C2G38_2198594 [Gigaspora rosea]
MAIDKSQQQNLSSSSSPSSSSSLSDMADILMHKLDRTKVFPPYYNKPEDLINPSKQKTSGIPRPPNGFLLCRKNVHKQAKQRGIHNMRVISKVTGMLWRSASPQEKELYERLALDVQNLHSQRYPGYKYKPTSRAKPPTTCNLNHEYHEYYQPYMIPPQILVVPTTTQFQQTPLNMTYPITDSLLQFTQQDIDLLNWYWTS